MAILAIPATFGAAIVLARWQERRRARGLAGPVRRRRDVHSWGSE
jgi:hypothetical protein